MSEAKTSPRVCGNDARLTEKKVGAGSIGRFHLLITP
jgi:hypothetical protein